MNKCFGTRPILIMILNWDQKSSGSLSKDINSDEEDEKYDPNNTKKRGQGPKINVKKAKW